MPKLNLKDDGLEESEGGQEQNESPGGLPTLREIDGGGGRISPIVLILLAVVVLAAGVFTLNYFKVINLWGKKPVQVTAALPEPEGQEAFPPGDTQLAEPSAREQLPLPGTTTEVPATSPTIPEERPSEQLSRPSATQPPVTREPRRGIDITIVPTGTGEWTVQFSAFLIRGTAVRQAELLAGAGYDAYVSQARHQGRQWYRVRVGRFETRGDAEPTADRLQKMTEDPVWITKISGT